MGHFARFFVKHLFVERFGTFDGRATNLGSLATGRIFLESGLSEEGSQLVVLILRPAFEGMVVALVAVEAHGQEQMRRVLHDQVGIAQDLVVRGCRILFIGSTGGQDLSHNLIVGPIFGDGCANPIAEGLCAFAAQRTSS